MSKLISRSLPFLFTLTLAGAAFARRPSALVEAQERADRVYSTCAESQARSSVGYRDALSRIASARPSTRHMAAASHPARKMGDHLVLVCKGGEVHLGSGYRGFPPRPQPELTDLQIAAAPKLVSTR